MNGFTEQECKQRVKALPEYLCATLKLMAEGRAIKEIADAQQITPSTAYVYRERVYSRLGVNNLALATRIAFGDGSTLRR